MKSILKTILLFCAVTQLHGQGLHFTASHEMPLHINPAYTGVMPKPYEYQLIVAHRRQTNPLLGRHDYESYYLSGHYRYMDCAGGNRNFFGIGFEAYHDHAGILLGDNTQFFQTISTKAKFSYGYGLSDDIFMVAGIELGYLTNGLDNSNLRFDNQFGDRDFEQGLPTGEMFSDKERIHFFDLGTGFLLMGDLDKFNFEAGFSILHLKNKKHQFLIPSAEQDLLRTFNFHTRLHFDYGRGNLFSVSMMFYKQGAFFKDNGKAWQFQPRAELSFLKEIFIGTGLRLTNVDQEALNFDGLTFTCKWKPFRKFDDTQRENSMIMGVAYDLNLSPYLARATSLRGGFEVFASFLFGNVGRKGFCCPEF